MKNTIICSILTFGCLSIAAQARELRDSALIYFHQGKADLDTAYNTNGDNLNRLINHINADIRQDSALRIAAVRVTGAASPEGSVEINRKLSKKRADRIFGFFFIPIISSRFIDFLYLHRPGLDRTKRIGTE